VGIPRMVIAEKGGGRGRVAKSRCHQGNGEGVGEEDCTQTGEASRVESSSGGEESVPWTGGGGVQECSGSREGPGSVTHDSDLVTEEAVSGGVGEASGAGVWGRGSANSPSDDVGIRAGRRWIPAAGEDEDLSDLYKQEATGGEGREPGGEREVEMEEGVVGWIRRREPETELSAPD
jgi:hypothetical protein